MSTAVAKNLMADMKLFGMLGAFEQSISDATRDQTSYTELLDCLLQAEADYRQERKTGYRIKAAKFTLRPAFEDIDFTASRSISKTQIKELYSLQWLHEARPVLLIGQTGVGKTFIAQATGLHACACGKSVLYMSVTTWLENLALARSSGTYLKYRDKLAKPDLCPASTISFVRIAPADLLPAMGRCLTVFVTEGSGYGRQSWHERSRGLQGRSWFRRFASGTGPDHAKRRAAFWKSFRRSAVTTASRQFGSLTERCVRRRISAVGPVPACTTKRYAKH
jgi:IstB-like ATP binding protein